ncbi:MAG TPA: FecR domain-containing protein [Cyclobacteriaceae bacterium]|mgnify:FL=1|nr:FecR domain-containing protein [Cyclobacteriaceae bacterium]HRJ81029.1 FecR domain-containing protein [Cyclobacteriaceae bacterium]
MEKTDFDLLMERYVTGKVSDQERVKIEAWLDAMGAEDNTELDLTKEEEDRIFRKLTDSLTTVEDMAALKPKRKIRADQWMIRIAASLVILSLVSYVVWYYAAPRENQLEVVSKNGVEKIILNDGSLVWLRGESKVMYYEKPDERARYTTFEGEALFEVAKDESHPFIVQCGDVKVRVLGTSFSIRTTVDQVELTVLTGKVNLSSAANSEGIDVLPQEKVIYKSNGEFEKLTTNEQEITSITENTDYNMQFTNIGMGEVVDRLESKFNVSIKLSNKSIRNCKITMDFTDQSLEKSLQLITEVLDVTYSVKDKTVTITGTGCK